MQQHEMLEWLGDDHGLTVEQIADLTRTADEIAARYPGPDDADERQAALTVAYRLMVEEPERVVAEIAQARTRARLAEVEALAGLRQAALSLVDLHAGKGGAGITSQAGFAQRAGVARKVVRGWLGLGSDNS